MLTSQVSCFGGDELSDAGDYWRYDLFTHAMWMYVVFIVDYLMIFLWVFFRLEIEGSGKVWKRDQKVRLRHVDTGGFLHSHNKKYNRLGGGQQEVRYLFVCNIFLQESKDSTVIAMNWQS